MRPGVRSISAQEAITFIKSIGGARIDARISEVSGSPGRSLRSRCGASPASPLIPELIETPFCRRAR